MYFICRLWRFFFGCVLVRFKKDFINFNFVVVVVGFVFPLLRVCFRIHLSLQSCVLFCSALCFVCGRLGFLQKKNNIFRITQFAFWIRLLNAVYRFIGGHFSLPSAKDLSRVLVAHIQTHIYIAHTITSECEYKR